MRGTNDGALKLPSGATPARSYSFGIASSKVKPKILGRVTSVM